MPVSRGSREFNPRLEHFYARFVSSHKNGKTSSFYIHPGNMGIAIQCIGNPLISRIITTNVNTIKTGTINDDDIYQGVWLLAVAITNCSLERRKKRDSTTTAKRP